MSDQICNLIVFAEPFFFLNCYVWTRWQQYILDVGMCEFTRNAHIHNVRLVIGNLGV
jgi:hypothetical protein